MPTLTIYLNDEFYDYIKQTGKKPSHIIREALEKYREDKQIE